MQNSFDNDRARKATYPGDDEAAVYKEVLGYFKPDRGMQTAVYATTRSACIGSSCKADYMGRIRFDPRVMLATMENFFAVREQALDFRINFTPQPEFVLVGDSAIVALNRAAGRSDALNNLQLVKRAWPQIGALISLSAVGFSPRHEQAAVEVMREGVALLWVLNRTPTGWQVVQRLER
jgi:hypothetical protein